MNGYPSTFLIFFIMSDFTTSAALLSSSLNSLGGSIANTNLNKANRKWSEKMADLAYQRQQELTRKAPSLQKLGLIDAGISPAAMNGYSPGIPTVNTASSPSTFQEFQPFDLNALLNTVSVESQKKVADSVAEKNYADAEKSRIESGRYDELTDATIAKIKSETQLNDEQIKEVAAHIPVLNNQGDYFNWLATQADLDYQKNAATYQSDIDRIKAQNELSEKQAKAYVKLVDQYASAQLNLIYAQTYNARATGQAQLSQAYTARLNYQLEASFKDLKAEIMSWDIEKSKKEAYLIKREGEEYGLNQKAMRDVQDALRRKLNMETNLAPVNSLSGLIGAATGVAGAVAPGPKHIGGFR